MTTKEQMIRILKNLPKRYGNSHSAIIGAMKNAIIFHGSGTTPDAVWQPWLKKELQKKGYSVSIPVLTSDDPAALNVWLPLALKENYNDQTVLIGHSSGAPLTLSVLENLNVKVKQAILVAGFISPLLYDKGYNPILQKKYDWNKIKKNANEFIFINSVNDPWGCNEEQGKAMFNKLGGSLIVNKEGHMGSQKFNQPYKEFPFLLRLIE
ncbi:MAG: Alpha/beta fold family hydrolase [Candidatus Levybacteria bacterium GW2011_GWB1_41_21]|nr:MAG: Alpha/beta fold family hydrolase [Candidatus Levybacteria bacterium GW2011_GWA2_41_15]KKS02450.1 MAG: Alpha/beta fold family hydrolase [Candidatus Levybacteria bacterium GW2011_GWB1_41_21]